MKKDITAKPVQPPETPKPAMLPRGIPASPKDLKPIPKAELDRWLESKDLQPPK